MQTLAATSRASIIAHREASLCTTVVKMRWCAHAGCERPAPAPPNSHAHPHTHPASDSCQGRLPHQEGVPPAAAAARCACTRAHTCLGSSTYARPGASASACPGSCARACLGTGAHACPGSCAHAR